MASTWTKEQVEDLLRREAFTYQRIELPYGLATGGADRSSTARAIFPESLAGKSVLDLGCNNGYFCFEAARRGATRVLGLDVEHDMIRKNRILADVLGLDVKFDVVDLDKQRLAEPFDYVLCLNVLHHLRYPLYTLDNLSEIVREKLVLEMVSFGFGDSLRMGVFPALAPLLARQPVIFVSPGHARKKLKRSVITKPALENLLMTHRRIFSRCTIKPSEFKDRYLAIAEKYDIDHLVVVAGPSGSDRSGFAKALTEGKLPAVEKAIGGTVKGAAMLPSPGLSHVGVAVMDYDILNPFMRTGNVYSRDVELDLLNVARKVSFVTLKQPAASLAKAYQASLSKGRIFGKPSKRQRRILESFASEESLAKHYPDWEAFAQARGKKNLSVTLRDDGSIASTSG